MTAIDPGRAYYAGLLEALTHVMGSAKGYLRNHGPRVAVLANRIGIEMGLDADTCAELIFAAVLSDMGMVGLAEDAWENPVPELSDDVRARVRKHPERSQERVRQIPHFEALGSLIRHHHEWWNGSGYPDGLAGESIPIGAQVLRLADTVTALGTERPHRGALAPPEIREIVRDGAGVEFGPDVVRAFFNLRDEGHVGSLAPGLFRGLVLAAVERLVPLQIPEPSSNQLLTIMANLIDAKDPYTAGHSRRVALLAVSVADQMGLPGDVKSQLWACGYLHDLGKLAVPLRVLAKEGRLTDEEFDYIRAHPGDGAGLLEGIPPLRHLTPAVRHHHERWDGKGYPDGLREEEIPMEAQIMAVCDAYDAMTSRRAYRDSLGPDYALKEVARERGAHFGPEVADGFLAIPHDILDGLHRSEADAFRAITERVGTLRMIDPRWLTSPPPARF